MSSSWWDLGEGSGRLGDALEVSQITCPFCSERGKFAIEHHAEKKKPNSAKQLNFDTLRCTNCTGYVLVLWSASEYGIGMDRLYQFRVLPWPLQFDTHPDHWPPAIGSLWLQSHRSLHAENWDAAAVMARSAMQLALRDQGAPVGSLFSEVESLAAAGAIPPLMKDWAHEVRLLGNESAHPSADQPLTNAKDARDIVNYLDYLLEYLYDLPKRITDYRARKN